MRGYIVFPRLVAWLWVRRLALRVTLTEEPCHGGTTRRREVRIVMRQMVWGALVVVLSLTPALSMAEEASASDEVSYYRDVRPIFRDRCQGCHQPAKASGKFVLTTFELLMKGGRSDADPIVVPGKPDESLLVAEISPQGDEAPAMPKNAEPLSAGDVELIRQWIAAGAKDDTPASEKVKFGPDNPPVYEHLPVISSLDISSDGEHLAVAGYHEVLLHKPDGSELTGRLVGLSERVQSVRFSPDGKTLAVTGGAPSEMGEVQIWDVERQRLRLSVPLTFDTIYGVSWSRDGKVVAFGCSDNSVRAVDAKSGEQVLFQGAHGDWVLGTTFSVDSSHLVSVGRDRSMKLIKVDTEQFIDNITSITPGRLIGGLMTVECHPTRDELVIGGADGIAKIYRMHRVKARKIGDDYNLLQQFESVEGRIFSARFNPAGDQLVMVSSYNGRGEVRACRPDTVEERQAKEEKLSDAEKKSLIPALGKIQHAPVWKLPLDGAVYTAAYTHDGKIVAVGGFDGYVRLVDAATGEVKKKFVPVPIDAQKLTRAEQKQTASAEKKSPQTAESSTKGSSTKGSQTKKKRKKAF